MLPIKPLSYGFVNRVSGMGLPARSHTIKPNQLVANAFWHRKVQLKLVQESYLVGDGWWVEILDISAS